MSDLYSNDTIRERAERIVQTDVIYCVTSLIYELSQDYEVISKLKIEDEINEINESLDWEEPARNHIEDMDADDCRSFLDDNSEDYESPDEDDEGNEIEGTGDGVLTLREKVIAYIGAEHDGWKDFCEENSIDPDTSEVYEHWIVSSWLAARLAEKGHATGEVLGLTIWGRPTTGQAISMDSVMLEIANDLENMK